eukprot:1636791-Amphidinium_carterae.1
MLVQRTSMHFDVDHLAVNPYILCTPLHFGVANNNNNTSRSTPNEAQGILLADIFWRHGMWSLYTKLNSELKLCDRFPIGLVVLWY